MSDVSANPDRRDQDMNETVELVVPSGIEHAAQALSLPATKAPTSAADIRRWTDDVNARLRVGVSQLQAVHVGDSETPTAVVVGGWPVDEPCCAGTAAPDTDDILHGGAEQMLWECEDCGEILEPTYWTVMPLGRLSDRSWALPDVDLFVSTADAAVVAELHLRTRRSIDAAMRAAAMASAGDCGGAGAAVRVGPVADSQVRPDLWRPAAIAGADLDSAGRAIVEVGFFGAELPEPQPDKRSFAVTWLVVDRLAMSPADLTRMLPTGKRLTLDAASGTLSGRDLSIAWAGRRGSPAPWLCEGAVISDLADAGRQAGAAGGEGLGL